MTTLTGEFERNGEGAGKKTGTRTTACTRRHCDTPIKKHARLSKDLRLRGSRIHTHLEVILGWHFVLKLWAIGSETRQLRRHRFR
jgi:hypothetical protein